MNLDELDALKDKLDALRPLPAAVVRNLQEALDAAHVDGVMGPFMELMTECVREGFAPYWHVLGIDADGGKTPS